MTRRAPILLALALVALPSVASAQQRVAITPVSGINVHESYLQAAGDLFRGHLMGKGGFAVITVPGQNSTQELSAPEAIGAGQASQADLVIVLHLTKLGSSAKIRMSVYDVRSGHLVRSEQLSAGSPDDVDPVMARLAEALVSGRPAKDTADIETVTEKEADPLLKRTATSTWGLKIGMLSPLTSPSGDHENAIPGLSIFWLYDARSFLAEVDLGFHSKGGDGDGYVGLGAYYPFSREDFSPYAGLAIRYTGGDLGGDGTGIQVAGVGGVIFGRLSTVQVRGDIQYFINTFESEHYDYNTDQSKDGLVHGLMFNVGIGF